MSSRKPPCRLVPLPVLPFALSCCRHDPRSLQAFSLPRCLSAVSPLQVRPSPAGAGRRRRPRSAPAGGPGRQPGIRGRGGAGGGAAGCSGVRHRPRWARCDAWAGQGPARNQHSARLQIPGLGLGKNRVLRPRAQAALCLLGVMLTAAVATLDSTVACLLLAVHTTLTPLGLRRCASSQGQLLASPAPLISSSLT